MKRLGRSRNGLHDVADTGSASGRDELKSIHVQSNNAILSRLLHHRTIITTRLATPKTISAKATRQGAPEQERPEQQRPKQEPPWQGQPRRRQERSIMERTTIPEQLLVHRAGAITLTIVITDTSSLRNLNRRFWKALLKRSRLR